MPSYPTGTSSGGGVNIEAWTNDAIEALSTVHISAAAVAAPASSGVRGTSVTLDIPLDVADPASAAAEVARQRGKGHSEDGDTPARHLRQGYSRPLLRRDSLKRREALLKGKEGSRRRQKWENDHFIGNPWAEPPEPGDFQPKPTHPVHAVPYFLAPLWDERKVRSKVEQAARAREVALQEKHDSAGRVPREFREKLKRSKAAKGLLQDLEEQVREFVLMWEEKERQLKAEGLADSDIGSSEDEEIVFVGRNGQMRDGRPQNTASDKQVKRDKMIFDSLVDDHGASFGRWLVHSIATYYNLRTWSVTRGNPARREAYIGVKEGAHGPGCGPELSNGLPRPLWAMV